MKLIVNNKKAYFDYEVISDFEAGIVLIGDEVKSLRAGHVTVTGSFAHIHKGELFLVNCSISTYAQAFLKDDKLVSRSRKLLVHRREMHKLIGEVSCRGATLVLLKLYFNDRNKVKALIGLCKHKKAETKKSILKERDIARDVSRDLKNIVRY